MRDMRFVILVYIAIYTDAYISKPIKAKECIWRTYTYLCVIHYDHRANNLKRTHGIKEKGKKQIQNRSGTYAISTCSLLTLKDADDIPGLHPLRWKWIYLPKGGYEFFRILYLNVRRSSRMLYASSSACSLFWTFSWSVNLYYISCNMTIYLFFMHLPNCFSVTVELLCRIQKAVCSARELIVLTYFCCFSTYSKRIECYHCPAGRVLQVHSSPHTSSFFMTYVFDLCCIIHGQIQEIHLMKSLFFFSPSYYQRAA